MMSVSLFPKQMKFFFFSQLELSENKGKAHVK